MRLDFKDENIEKTLDFKDVKVFDAVEVKDDHNLLKNEEMLFQMESVCAFMLEKFLTISVTNKPTGPERMESIRGPQFRKKSVILLQIDTIFVRPSDRRLDMVLVIELQISEANALISSQFL